MKCTVEMELPFPVLCLFGTCIAFLGGKAGQQLTPAAAISARKSDTGLDPVASDLVAGESTLEYWWQLLEVCDGPGSCRSREL